MIPVRHNVIYSPRRSRAGWAARGRIVRAKPPTVLTLACAGNAVGLYRVADPTLDRYEVYRGIDASPDFSGSPFATGSTLPITTPALSTSHKHHLVIRHRNAWNLLSQNTIETIFDVSAGGTLNATPPSDPTSIGAEPYAAGTVLISASYDDGADGANAANEFLLYITFDGSAPTPGVTPATTVAMSFVDGWARLAYVTAAQTEGTVVKAIVRSRRTGTPNVDSTGSTIFSATATLLGPAAPALQVDAVASDANQQQ